MVAAGQDRGTGVAPRWLWGFWIVVAVAVGLVRYGIDMGDRGLVNVSTMVLLVLALLVSLTWFTLRSGHSARTRYGVTIGFVVLLAAGAALFRIDGVRAEMIPIVSFRFTSLPASPGELAAPVGAIDLVTTTPADFPGFLGPHRDLRVQGVRLATDWDTRAPELLWSHAIGAGWSGFAVVNGYAATLEERGGRELVTLYDIDSGDMVWMHQVDKGFSHPLGGRGPRSTPTIDSGLVFAMGVHGKLMALDGASGDLLWQHDLLVDYGISPQEEVKDVGYGRSTSPLVVGDLVIVGVGGSRRRRVSLAAYDKHTGELQWEGGEHNISMASPALGTLGGSEQVLLVNEGWVSGHEIQTGGVLWEFEWPGMTAGDASVSQAVAIPPDRVFVSKGYGLGAALYELEPRGDGTFEARELWHQARTLRTKLTNVAIRDGYVYGLSEGILECVELDTGRRAWKAGRYHHGQILLVGELLLVLTEDGEIVLVEATPERKNSVLGRFQAIDGHTWNNIALYGDILLVRNGQQAAAYRLPLHVSGSSDSGN